MYPLFRSLLFCLDPETAHGLTLRLIRLAGQLPPVQGFLRAWFRAPSRPVQAFGLTFANPIGLAAGYDKDALGWRGLATLGFGHIEVGTVTPLPQPGNPRPRLFRLVQERTVINRMGFPGLGAEFVARQLGGPGGLYPPRPKGLVLGVNIGKNKDTPLEEAARDYLSLLGTFAPLADYLAINVSSPNTVGLRRLQAREALQELLSALDAQRQQEVQRLGRPVPLLVKLAPDLSDAELDDALDAILATGMDGVIATNTTLGREGVPPRWVAEAGGLSGAPLRALSTEMVRKITVHTQGARTESTRTEGARTEGARTEGARTGSARTGSALPVIGVGGVASAQDAQEKLDAGACLVQVYTGLIYEGPGLVKRILKGIYDSPRLRCGESFSSLFFALFP
jgi:dihydroorotate dehydrogenase